MSTLGIIVLVIISILAGFFINSIVYYAKQKVKIDRPAPGFYAELLEGDKIGLGEWEKPPKPILLCFVSPHCNACRRLAQLLEELKNKYKDAGIDVILLGINGSKEDFIKWKDSLKIDLPIAVDINNTSKIHYVIYSLPAVFYISSEGLIKMIHTGFRTGDDEKLAGLFKTHLGNLSTQPVKRQIVTATL
ncbi:MAG: redoxin domain-containing protein [FCB group bacterium]|nr:redoxin domain-containing protein [FCB group bacterium]